MNDERKPKIETRGGAGRGQGRKPSEKPNKIPVGVNVEVDTKAHLKSLSETSGHSQAAIVEWLIKRTNKLPKKI